VSAQLWILWRSLWIAASLAFNGIQRKSLRDKSKAPLTRSTPKLFPLASELERALPNRLADRLVGGDGVEPFGLRLVVVSQEVKQTQRLTLCLAFPRSMYHSE